MMKRFFPILCALLLTAFFGVFFFLPLCTVVTRGLHPGMLQEVLRNSLYRAGLWNALAIGLVTTFLVFLIAMPLALLYDRFEFPGKRLCPALMMLPMILPPFVGALGFQRLLGHYGVLNGILGMFGRGPADFLSGEGCFWSICLIEALHLYPVLYLNLTASLSNLDPSMIEAAKNAGVPRRARFFRITLPLVKPGLLAGVTLVLIWSFTELGTPLMFGYTVVTPVQIFNGITELGSNPAACTLVLLMLAATSVLYLLCRIFLGSAPAGMGRSVKGASGSSARHLKDWKRFAPGGVFWTVTAFACLPHLALILSASSAGWYRTILPLHYSLAHFREALSDKLVAPAIANSLKYSLIATLAACAAGLAIAYLTRRSRLPFAGVFDWVGMLPMMIPGLVIAVGYLGMSIRYSWAAVLFDPIGNPVILIAAAYAVRRIPYVLRAAAGGLEQTPLELEDAGRNAGSGAFGVFRKITLPLIAANLVAGALFAFSFSMLEVSDSLVLAQRTADYPITKAIYELSMYLGNGPSVAAAFGVWSLFFLASTLIAAGLLLGKKLGALFRM